MNSLESELISSMESKNIEKLKELLKKGFPVNRHIRKEDQKIGSHTYPLIFAIEKNLIPIIPSLLHSGANPNCFDSIGCTPLMAASAVGNLEILKLLLQYKADLTIRDFFGNTLLHVAGVNGRLNILKFCINELKIPAIVKNRKGQTPLMACIEAQEDSKSLNDIENLQESIEYLWKIEDEFKKIRIKDRVSKNSYIKKHPRFNLSDLASVSIEPEEKHIQIPGNIAKRSIQMYLKSKHMSIVQNESNNNSYKSNKFSPISTPGIRSASVKPLANLFT